MGIRHFAHRMTQKELERELKVLRKIRPSNYSEYLDIKMDIKYIVWDISNREGNKFLRCEASEPPQFPVDYLLEWE